MAIYGMTYTYVKISWNYHALSYLPDNSDILQFTFTLIIFCHGHFQIPGRVWH